MKKNFNAILEWAIPVKQLIMGLQWMAIIAFFMVFQGLPYIDERLAENTKKIIAEVAPSLVAENNKDVYIIAYTQIVKQEEKINNNPDDIKNADRISLSHFCNKNSDFMKYFASKLPLSEQAKIDRTCDVFLYNYTK